MSTPKPLNPFPVNAPAEASQIIAARNDLACLAAIGLFGHCRQVELALAGWPHNPRGSAEVLAGRAIQRLLERGHIIERRNSLPGRSYVLGMGGVARLKRHGIPAVDGAGLSVTGVHLWHRILGTRYLLERKAATGSPVWGEYALEKGWAPVKRAALLEQFEKLPDGLVQASPGVLDWVEIEHAKGKSTRPMLEVVTHAGEALNSDGSLRLGRVFFVYDRTQPHEAALLQGLLATLRDVPVRKRERVLSAIVFVPVEVELPLAWKSYEEVTGAVAVALSGLNDNWPPKKPRKISRKQQAVYDWERAQEQEQYEREVAGREASRDADAAQSSVKAPPVDAEKEPRRHPITGEPLEDSPDDEFDWQRGDDD
jgi:hypothetical protein